MSYPFFPFKLVQKRNNEVEVLSPYTNDGFKVNASAVQILNLCNGSRSLEEITAELSARFRSTESQITRLTGNFVRELADQGILWVRKEKMRWFNPPAPQSIFWEITAECNLKCLHCVVSADKKLEKELSTEEGFRLIREWQAMGVRDITFSGGEPLLRKDFFHLARATKEHNLSVHLATNGTTITPSTARDIKKLEVNVQVSLDGSNPEIYGNFRGRKEAFSQAVSGIEALLKSGVEVTIGMVITRQNVHDIPDMLKLVENYGVQYFRLIPFIPYGRGKLNKKLELEPGKVKEVTTYLAQRRPELPFEILPMEFEHTLSQPPAYGIDPSRPSECGGAIHYCTVTPEGEVLPCHYFEGVKADSVKDQSFTRIWGGSRFLNYFRSLQIGDITGHCGQCQWLAVCRGGCKAANFSHGTLFHSNRHCWVADENENQ